MIIRITTLTACRNIIPPLEKKLWLLPLNEIYKGKNIIVYISILYNTFPEASTNTALFSRICTIKVQDHQIKCISIMHGQLWQNLLSYLIFRTRTCCKEMRLLLRYWLGSFELAVSSMMQHKFPWEPSKSVLLRALHLLT